MRAKRKSTPKPELTGTQSDRQADTETIGHIYRDRPDESDDPPMVHVPRPGDSFGHYRLCEKLGEGSSCHVFRGWDETHQLPIAVKIVNWENVVDRTAALRQMRVEAAALARVNHPKVVRFIDLGYDPRWPYLVTEYIDGQTLGLLLNSGGALPPVWALHLIGQVADGLGAVWRAGLVHRDVKPDNILIGSEGVAKLIDFGLAKAPVLQAASGTTGPEMAGTAAYLSPEQARDASVVDFRADIYSLGVTLYEALTGRLPFDGRNKMQVIYQHINAAPVPPIDVNPKVSGLASDLCLWMLAKQPHERPENIETIRAALEMVRASLGPVKKSIESHRPSSAPSGTE